MIFDSISNWKQYFKQEIFTEIFEELKTLNLDSPDDIYHRRDNYYFKVITYKTKVNPEIIENHLKEVDIQILLSGQEKIKVYNKDAVTVTREYMDDDDCKFYKQSDRPHTEIILQPGYMAVFFSNDIHGCQHAVEDNKIESLKKIVIKVDEKLFA